MIPRSLQQVFAALQAQPEGTTYSVQCSFVELYLAHTRDLLGAEARSHDGKLIAPDRQLRDGKGGVYIVDLAKRPLKSVEDAILAIKDGTRHRVVAEMNMNKRSSRGHAILCAAPPGGRGGQPTLRLRAHTRACALRVRAGSGTPSPHPAASAHSTVYVQRTTGKTGYAGKLNLVDLAGMESAGGQPSGVSSNESRKNETKHIKCALATPALSNRCSTSRALLRAARLR